MITCGSCRAVAAASDRFCGECGAALDAVSKSDRPPVGISSGAAPEETAVAGDWPRRAKAVNEAAARIRKGNRQPPEAAKSSVLKHWAAELRARTASSRFDPLLLWPSSTLSIIGFYALVGVSIVLSMLVMYGEVVLDEPTWMLHDALIELLVIVPVTLLFVFIRGRILMPKGDQDRASETQS